MARIEITAPKLAVNRELLAAALRLILDGTPNWNPHDGNVLTIHCTTAYVLSPYPVSAVIDADLIDAARRDFPYSAATMEHALHKSVSLQAHYAKLLNMYDGGKRMIFETSQQWIERLAKTTNTTG